MTRNQDGWIKEYTKKNALWIHDGNLKRPHALLTGGDHSNGFFNNRLVISDRGLMRDAAEDLLELFTSQGGDVTRVQGVVGPQTGATLLAELLSDRLDVLTMGETFFASPAKHQEGDHKSMVFNEKEGDLLLGRTTLLCEDVLTTGGSVERTDLAITQAGGTTFPFILALVNRSGLTRVGSKKIIALINCHMPKWAVPKGEICPLCAQGSQAVRPKDNWALLNGEY